MPTRQRPTSFLDVLVGAILWLALIYGLIAMLAMVFGHH
jgi:hypothetical protein